MDSKICVLGLGYIGLPTSSILANNGYWVTGVDINKSIVERINKGEIHIHESGLAALVKSVTQSGHLVARTEPVSSDVFIIAVPTPITQDKQADLAAVISASESIVPHLRKGNIVILESTVPPGTTDDLVIPILERSGFKAKTDFQVVHAPERVLPGDILGELVKNDRIIGGIDQESCVRAQHLYQSFAKGNIYLTDLKTAELVKLVENTYRDVNIAFANELARISANLNINVWEVIELANKHPRVNILQPGPGVGGHCIAVDPWFIVECYPQDSQLIKTAREENDYMPTYVTRQLLRMLSEVSNPKVSILGMSYKANVDDTRESPSREIVKQLQEFGCDVKVHDPYVYPDIPLEKIVDSSDLIALLVDHNEYRDLDSMALGNIMRNKNIFIARKAPSIDQWIKAGFKVEQIGNSMLFTG